jgi:hypothetical protein
MLSAIPFNDPQGDRLLTALHHLEQVLLEPEGETETCRQAWCQVQEAWQEALLPTHPSALPLQTEIQRTLRLLATELEFWFLRRRSGQSPQKLLIHCQNLQAYYRALPKTLWQEGEKIPPHLGFGDDWPQQS